MLEIIFKNRFCKLIIIEYILDNYIFILDKQLAPTGLLLRANWGV